jgi:branched-chain amino acid aminotransferase
MNKVWFESEITTSEIMLSPFDRGLILGDGIFETLAVTDGVVLWQDEHLARMAAAALELGLPFAVGRIEKAIQDLTRSTTGHHVLRLTLTRGVVGRGLSVDATKPTLIATLQPFDVTLRFQPLTLATSSIRRNLQSPSSRIKTLSYIDSVLAAREATTAGRDDALQLNTAGRVACATIGNVFFDMGGTLLTPSLKEGLLPGVMRGAIITAAKRMGIVLRERQVRVTDIASADAMCVTNSLRFLRGVTRCDNKRFTKPSKLFNALCKALLDTEQNQIMSKKG